MEIVPVVLRAMEFQAPKQQREEIPKGKLYPKSLFSFLGLSSSCFLPHPGSSGREGRRSRDSWLRGQGWVAREAFQGLRKTWRSSASRAQSQWETDLGGGRRIKGGHELGSAPSAALGDTLFGNSNLCDEPTHP